jgi:hypothetical protein
MRKNHCAGTFVASNARGGNIGGGGGNIGEGGLAELIALARSASIATTCCSGVMFESAERGA